MLHSLLALALVTSPSPSDAQDPCRAVEHAPAALRDFLDCAAPGTWTVALRASETHFQGLVDGAQRLTSSAVLAQGYAEVPHALSQRTETLEIGATPSEGFSLRAALPFVENRLDAKLSSGERFSLRAQGLGDVQIGAGLSTVRSESERVAVGLTVSAPTGSITESDARPSAGASRLEYPLQPGSGTWDLSPSLAWRLHDQSWNYGLDLEGTLHNGHNGEGWARGDRFAAAGWAAYEWSPGFSGSVRLAAERWGNLRGADTELDPAATPIADPHKQSGERVDAALGLNWMPEGGLLKGGLVGLELGKPLAQDLVGPQLAADWFATLGVTLSF